MKRRKSYPIAVNHRRAGVTLSEVLVSLLVMSIGVVSLVVLFPISVLRSAQATHLTNSANLRYNLEALLGARPELYSISKSWTAGTSYAVGDLVIPMELTAVKAPPVVFQCSTAGTSGVFEPNWNYFNGGRTPVDPMLFDGTAAWTTIRVKNYVVDPLGQVLLGASASDYKYRHTANNGDFFGNDGSAPYQLIRAFSGGVSTEAAADDLATLPDNWINEVESRQMASTSTSCTMTDLQELISPVSNGLPVTRIVMFDSVGKTSHVRFVTSTTANGLIQTVNWSEPLPTGFTPAIVKVDLKSRRYTWLLSVRRSFGGASLMDVVVFFKRPFSPKDEQVYPASFQTGLIDTSNSIPANDYWVNFVTDPGYDGLPGVASFDDDGVHGTDNVGELGWPGSDDAPRNWVVIQYDATGDKPFVKKGGYVTDAENLRWYRILDYFEGSDPKDVMKQAGINVSAYTPDAPVGNNFRSYLLRIENKILQNGTQPSGGPGGVPRGRAMLMRGIIDVYPIRTHQTWDN